MVIKILTETFQAFVRMTPTYIENSSDARHA